MKVIGFNWGVSSGDTYAYYEKMLTPKSHEVMKGDSFDSERTLQTEVSPFVATLVTHIDFIRTRRFVGSPFGFEGAVLRHEDHVLLSIQGAILGYDGSGPSLSKRIMEWVGLTATDFQTMNRMFKGKTEYLLSIELHRENPS